MESTQSKILDAAERFIITSGYNAFSYSDISKKIGIKTSSIHYHFPTKTKLSIAVVHRYKERFLAKLQEIRGKTESGLSQIEKYSKLVLNAFDNGNGFCLCLSLSADEASICEQVKIELRSFFRESQLWIAEAIQEGQKQKLIKKNLDPTKTAIAVVSLLEGAMIVSRANGEQKILKTSIQWIKQMLTK